MWHIFLLVPPLLSVVWAIIKVQGFKVRTRRFLIVFIAAAAVFYFTTQDYLSQTGVYPFVGAKLLHDLCACLLVPLIHLLVCYTMGITQGLKFFKISMWLLVLMIPDVCGLLVSLPVDEPLHRDDIFSYFAFSFNGHSTFKLQTYAFIIIVQTIIEVQRILVMRRIFIVRRLNLAKGAKWLVYLFFVLCGWIILTVIPSHETYANPVYNNIMLTGYSIIATLFCVGFVYFFNYDVVVDNEDHPVSMENDLDSTLAEDIRLLLEQDRIYTNSNLRIDDLAAMLSTNRTYVARTFRLKFGGTFTEVMNRYRVEHAKRLMLDDPKKRMEEVALESGFSSSNFFGRVFKALEGSTPSTWRSDVRSGKVSATTTTLPKLEAEPAVPQTNKRWVAPEKGMTTEEMLGLVIIDTANTAKSTNAANTAKVANLQKKSTNTPPATGNDEITPPRRK